jgi:N-acetylmuramoyl-L-alanine amidase
MARTRGSALPSPDLALTLAHHRDPAIPGRDLTLRAHTKAGERCLDAITAPPSHPRVIRFSIERRRAFGWLLLPMAYCVVPSALAAGARVASARLWPAQEYTRVIIEGPAPIPHHLRTLSNPPRVVLQLDVDEDAPELDQLPFRLNASDPYIAGIRIDNPVAGVVRIIFDLKVETKPQLFALAPVATFGHRVVLDLYPLTPVDPLMALLDEKRAPEEAAKPPSAAPDTRREVRPDTRRIERRKIVVALDPGHGGEDPGAIGQRGTYEKARCARHRAQVEGAARRRARNAGDDDARRRLLRAARGAREKGAGRAGQISSSPFMRTHSASGARAARRCSRSPNTARRARRRNGSRKRKTRRT